MTSAERLKKLADLITRSVRLTPEVERAAAMALEAISAGGKICFVGNGGSAAQAQHMATELVVRLRRDRAAIPALSLTGDSSILTALGNDMGAEEIFRRQVEALVGASDVLVAISTSGSSENVLAAADAAKAAGARLVAFTGARATRLHELADVSVCVPSEETPVVQELHLPLLHMFCDIIESSLSGETQPVDPTAGDINE